MDEWYDDSPMDITPMLIKACELAEEAGDDEFVWSIKMFLIGKGE